MCSLICHSTYSIYEIMLHDSVSPCFCLSIVITGNSNIGNIAYLSPYIQLYGMLTSMYYSVVVSVNICNITHFVKLKITDNITKNLEVYLVPSVNIKKVKLKEHIKYKHSDAWYHCRQ